MPRNATLLAFDLGATSGRAIAGRLHNGRISVQEIARFPNDPVFVSEVSGPAMHWDILAVWSAMRAALESLPAHGVEQVDSIGVDTWGVDYALLGEDHALIGS